jgi:hypothetical protein
MQTLNKILKSNRVDGDFQTHVSMVMPKGKFQFNRQTREAFYDVYQDVISSDKDKDIVLGVAEKPQQYIPILVDVDLKIKGEIPTELYTTNEVIKIVEIYQTALKDILENLKPEELTCVFLSKKPYKNDTHIKHGFHLHFPYIFMNKDSQKNHLLPRVRKAITQIKLFEHLGFEDSGKIIDSCYSHPWLMYGSRKDGAEMKPYLFDSVFDFKLNKINLEDAFLNYRIFDNKEHPINIKGKVEYYLPRILSIVPYGRDVKEVKRNVEKEIERKIISEIIKKDKEYDIPNPEDKKTEDICRKLLKLISDIRAEDRNEWMGVGWILHSVFQGSDTGLDLWKEFASRCSEKYDEYVHDNLWEGMTDRDDSSTKLSLGTLHFWAKEDNPVEYKKFISETYKNKISFELQDEIPFLEYDKKIEELFEEHEKSRADIMELSKSNKSEIEIRSEQDRKIYELQEKTTMDYSKVQNQCIQDMNRYNSYVIGCSKPYIISRRVNKDELGIKYVEYVRRAEKHYQQAYSNMTCPSLKITNSKRGPKSKPVPWVNLWIQWKLRKQYQEEVFQSLELECPPNLFNTFNGFNISRELATEKGTKDVSHVIKFIKKAWCEDRQDVCDWVLDWFAHFIQKPLVKMHSAIVLRGEEGIGKGIVVQLLSKIIGPQHFEQPSSSEDVLGKFTGILAGKALIFLDELVWGGDKQKAGILKKLITEGKGTVNEKFEPVRKFLNVVNLIMASNEDWVVPAGNNARRFMMLDVLNNHTDKEKDDVRLTCPYSFAKFLYDRDISKFEHNKIIATSGLAAQKELSSPDAIKFILEQVISEELPFDDTISFETLYTQFKSMYPHNKYSTIQGFSRDVNKVIDYSIYRPHGGKRSMKIPSKEDCRKSINKYFKQDMFESQNDTSE